jgi:predicted phosphodiesterase
MLRMMDLGELSGNLLLYGGPYSNFQATKTLLDTADRLGIGPQNRICTGDVLAYCAGVKETLALMRRRGGAVLAGNCEVQLGQGAGDCGCGFATGSLCSSLSESWYRHASALLSGDDRRWLASRPDRISFRHAGRRYVVIHGGAREVSRFLWPVSDEVEFASEIKYLQGEAGAFDAVIAGHCGIAFERRIGAVRWINPGAVGMPANDGCPDTRYAILSDGSLRLKRLSYDPATTIKQMQAAGLTQGYDRCLKTGVWPSQEVLPDALKRRAVPAP